MNLLKDHEDYSEVGFAQIKLTGISLVRLHNLNISCTINFLEKNYLHVLYLFVRQHTCLY